MIRALTLIAATASLAACATTLEVNQAPVPYTASKPLYERGTSSFTVRAYNATGKRKVEMSGILCSFQGDGFSSTFAVPAVVISPNLGPKTPAASVTCSFDGDTKTRALQPINRTLAQISGSVSTGAAAGAVGVAVGGVVATVQSVTRKEDNDVFGYPDVEIVFE